MTADRLVLWDIDGTLVNAGGIGAEVFDVAIERALGMRPPARIHMSGMTDPQIVRGYLDMLAVGEAEGRDHLPVILDHLAAELAAAESVIAERGQVLPGVQAVLSRLADEPAVVQTVLTGNVAPNAAVKLGAFGLQRWLDLDVGAYGSDHADRNELVPIALRRVADRRGRRFRPDQVWVVGDAPNDLACARAAGVRCLLVATGRPTHDELAALEPDALLADLSDTDEVVRLLLA
ncbi:MAG TPA: HAD family hydrolase [Acidimicrobiales bacterium]|nr:HAD family hydrolase [Acidimicrobiales bacterium]